MWSSQLCVWLSGLVYINELLIVQVVFVQAEDGIRDLVRSRGLGDVYKRQVQFPLRNHTTLGGAPRNRLSSWKSESLVTKV